MNIKRLCFAMLVSYEIRQRLSMRLLLTTDNVGHAAGGINTADVFRMGGVGIVAKQECYWKTDDRLEKGNSVQTWHLCGCFFFLTTHCAG